MIKIDKAICMDIGVYVFYMCLYVRIFVYVYYNIMIGDLNAKCNIMSPL